MPDYVRPSATTPLFVDALGRPIHYGQRWGADGPPDDSYSVTSNLERFAVLHDVAEALIAWLAETYDLSVEETPEAVADLLRAPTDAARVVRVRPADADASPLTFVFTSFPGIPLQAGLLFDSSYPICGCDACDETGESCASSLEEAVFAVADGGLSEARTPGVELSLSFRLDSARGSTGGSCREADYPVERQAAARDQLTPHRVWAPWPPRS